MNSPDTFALLLDKAAKDFRPRSCGQGESEKIENGTESSPARNDEARRKCGADYETS